MKKEALKQRFREYSAAFRTGIREVDMNLQLKQEHTLRVLAEAESLASAENFSETEKFLLYCAALFHDLSRVEQFVRFQTYNDADSFDHGERSYQLILQDDWLPQELSAEEGQIVLTAVRFHNKRSVPENISAAELKILAAVRDADKTDIFNILLQHLKNPENPAIVYKLSDFSRLSPKVAAAISAGMSPDNSDLETGLDFLAAKFAWGFDLNFRWTCQEFLKREYMQRLYGAIPENPELLLCCEKVLTFMQRKGMM